MQYTSVISFILLPRKLRPHRKIFVRGHQASVNVDLSIGVKFPELALERKE